MTETELSQMRQKWEAFGSRLKEGDGVAVSYTHLDVYKRQLKSSAC